MLVAPLQAQKALKEATSTPSDILDMTLLPPPGTTSAFGGRAWKPPAAR
jgi:hypothetical protein